ncbi:LamG domain-containing protein [Paenibacillus mesophilus]|nr:LamG domain-containing protein [Paenibacillus mesophilus]
MIGMKQEGTKTNSERIGYWPLREDCHDASKHQQHGQAVAVQFKDGAVFDGEQSAIVLPDSELTNGAHPFTLSMEFEINDEKGSIPGGICSRYTEEQMAGWHLSVLTQAGVTSTQPNWRNLQFGWSLRESADQWQDRGTPGNSRLICTLCVYDGWLYAGVFDDARDNKGRVYKLGENDEWIDCGNPDDSNSVWSLIEYKGKLYASTMRYKACGSSLPESPNMEPGGRIYRYEGDQTWSLFAEVPGSDSVSSMVVYQGKLIAMSFYTPGVYAYDENGVCEDLCPPGPEGKTRTMTLAPYRERLYIGCNELQGVYSRTFDENWVYEGKAEKCDQVYCFAVYHNHLLMGVWPEARMLRYEGDKQWSNYGLMGSELEVMGISMFNGKLYGGTLPGGHVYRYAGDGAWTLSGVLEPENPDIRYRRVWSMAVYGGELYAGTLPGGKVWSLRNDPLVTLDRSVTDGWHRTVITYDLERISLYLDGVLVSSAPIDPAKLNDLGSTPLVLGKGPQSHFSGKIREVELFDAAISEQEVADLYRQ